MTSENERAIGHFRRDILEGTFREGLSYFETSKKGQFKGGQYFEGHKKRDIFSRVHATLQPTLSVHRSVDPSVRPSHTSLNHV